VANGSRIELPLPGERGERLAAFSEGNIVLGLRPENIHCDGDGPNGEQVKSRVDLVEPLGAETHVHLSTGAHLFIAKTVGRIHPTIGDLLPLRFDMSKAFFFNAVSEARIC
jgi:multiple sugar transport system ATP-binding protein